MLEVMPLKKHVRRVRSAVTITLILSIAACAQTVSGPSNIQDPSAIVAGAWKLQSLARPDSTEVTVGDPNRFTLEFVDGGSRLALRADCNSGSGTYTANGRVLTVGPLAMTRAFCGSTAPFDDEYVRVLGGESLFTATASSFELSSSRGTLRFRR
jgi:heat shock protein HslJ